MIHDKAKIRSAKKFYYDAKNPRKTEKQKLLLHYKKKSCFSVKIQSVSVMRTMCCVVYFEKQNYVEEKPKKSLFLKKKKKEKY